MYYIKTMQTTKIKDFNYSATNYNIHKHFLCQQVITPQAISFTAANVSEDTFCVTAPHKDLHVIQALLMEGIATAILMLIACAAWDSRNANNCDSVAIKFGLGVTALATAVGPYTGCSMNPVRSLAPAVWNNNYADHWIYWFGPLGGALLASLAYKAVFSPKNDDNDDDETTIPENVALNSIDSHKPEVSNWPLSNFAYRTFCITGLF